MGRVGLLAPSSRIAALTAAVVATGAAIAFQPLAAPWWVYADGDATYAASGMELMGGEHTEYLDHPGMPLQLAMAATMEARYAAAGAPTPRTAYVDSHIVSLDSSRVVFRGWAIAFFVLAAAIVYLSVGALFGGAWWGAAGLLLWLAAPQIDGYSMRFLPDALQAGAVVGVCFLIVRSAQRRDAWTYLLAAASLGLALTVKLQAAGLAPAFAVALLWRPPPATWRSDVAAGASAWLRRHRLPLAAAGCVLVVLCAIFDRSRLGVTLTPEQRRVLGRIGLAVACYGTLVAAATLAPIRRPRLLSPFGPLLLAAFAVGLVLPVAPFVNDLPAMVVKMATGLTGGGVNNGVEAFTLPLSSLLHGPFVYTTALFALATVAAVVGAYRRDPVPVIWWAAAAGTGGLALARLGTPHYFQPPFALSIPAALWLTRLLQPARPRAVAPVAAALVVAIWAPQIGHLDDQHDYAHAEEAQGAALRTAIDESVPAGGVALADDYAAYPDVRWHDLVAAYLARVPAYPYRAVPPTAQADERSPLHLTRYVGFRALAAGDTVSSAAGAFSVSSARTTAGGVTVAKIAPR